MTPRTLTFIILAAVVSLISPVSAKEKKIPARTWKTVVDYVVANGAERKLSAPTIKLLGFDAAEITTKALRYKSDDSPDKMSHAIYVISAKGADGKSSPKEIVMGYRVAVTKDGVKSIDDYFLRTDLSGHIISAATSKGPAGHVTETILSTESPEAIAIYKVEQTIHLKTMDMKRLSPK